MQVFCALLQAPFLFIFLVAPVSTFPGHCGPTNNTNSFVIAFCSTPHCCQLLLTPPMGVKVTSFALTSSELPIHGHVQCRAHQLLPRAGEHPQQHLPKALQLHRAHPYLERALLQCECPAFLAENELK